MVLCKFFQSGNCRFGSKCHNDHFDLKQLIRTDVESAVNGKQWPFTCFGPFKDKMSIPNFIEDQSFEEIRLLCYEAKKNNFFEQFHQQFTREALEATNKMKTLLQSSTEVLAVLTQVYDSPDTSVAATTTPMSSAIGSGGNQFGLGVSAGATGASVFAKPTQVVGTNVFGGGFTNQTAPNNNASNIFGGGAGNNNTNNLFGGGGVGIGQMQQQLQPQQQTSIFGQQQPLQGTTNGGNIFAQPSQQAIGSSLFAQQQTQTTQPVAAGFGLFSQVAQQTSNLFGQQPNASPFGPPIAATFAQQAQQGGGVFNQTAPTNPTNIFAQAAQQTSQPIGGNIFATAAVPQQSNLFNQPQQTAPIGGGNMFTQATGIQQQPQTIQMTNTCYSRMEDLTPQDLAAFEAAEFTPGNVPFLPPPHDYIN